MSMSMRTMEMTVIEMAITKASQTPDIPGIVKYLHKQNLIARLSASAQRSLVAPHELLIR